VTVHQITCSGTCGAGAASVTATSIIKKGGFAVNARKSEKDGEFFNFFVKKGITFPAPQANLEKCTFFEKNCEKSLEKAKNIEYNNLLCVKEKV
jgi:hypothetical protein